MEVNYKKIMEIIDRQKYEKAGPSKCRKKSAGKITKLGRNEHVTTGILDKICNEMNCNIGDIMDITNESNQNIVETEKRPHEE